MVISAASGTRRPPAALLPGRWVMKATGDAVTAVARHAARRPRGSGILGPRAPFPRHRHLHQRLGRAPAPGGAGARRRARLVRRDPLVRPAHAAEQAQPRARRGAPASRYSVHGPFGYTGIGTSTRRSGSRRSTSTAGTWRRAPRSGRTLYVVHPDWRPEAGAARPRGGRGARALVRDAARAAGELGVESSSRTCPAPGCSHFTHPGDLDLRGLGLILDVGHASITGCLDEWLADPRAPLRHLHLHDNHGEGDVDDPHLAAGRRRGGRGGRAGRGAGRRRLSRARARQTTRT